MQWLPLSRHSAQTSPGTTRFFLSIHPLHLPYMIPCSYRASACKAVLPSCMAFYVISVRQTGDLPVVSLFPHPASFRFHLTMDTLAFGYILPTTGRIRDFNPLETCAARRTAQKRPCKDAGARRTAPWTARFDGFVKHRNPSSIISYSILPTKRSTRDSACATTVPAAAPRTTSINIDIQNLLKQILHTVNTDKNCRSIVQKCRRSRRKHTCHTKGNEP